MQVGYRVGETSSGTKSPVITRRPLHNCLWLTFGFSILCYIGHAGQILSLTFPLLAIVLGIYLIRKNLILYFSYSIWLWALSPIVRRLADSRSYYHPQSLIILAPVAVTLLGSYTVWRHRNDWFSGPILAFLLSGIAVIYGSLLSIIYNSPNDAITKGTQWIIPIVAAMFCYFVEDEQSSLALEFQRTMVRVATVVGVYGIYQYVSPPQWDEFWLNNVSLGQIAPSFGTAVPFGVRVFSTMHSPGNMAPFLATGLLLTFGWRTKENVLGIPFMLASLILSLVRTSWVGLICGLVFLTWKASRSIRLKMLLLVGGSALILPVALALLPGTTIVQRFATFGDLGHDGSAQARSAGIRDGFSLLADNPLGLGLGYMESASYLKTRMAVRDEVAGHDLGPLELLIEMGLPGTLLYFCGVVLLLRLLVTVARLKLAPVHLALIAICISFLTYTVSSSPYQYLDGFMMWCSAALLFKRNYVKAEGIVRFE